MEKRTTLGPCADQFSLKALISRQRQGQKSGPALNRCGPEGQNAGGPVGHKSGPPYEIKKNQFSSDKDRAALAAAEDTAWRAWLDACPRYFDGCFSCPAAMLDQVYFCREANRAIFGTDVIEVELIKDDGAAMPAGEGRHGVKLNLNLAGVRPWRERLH